jgi:tRNA nucleotidyltransferase (CCA-adding enzyme)
MQSSKQVYLVGGAVRDMLLQKAARGDDSALPTQSELAQAQFSVHDMDYVVVGASVEQMLAEGFTSVGKDFPVFLHPVTKDEYALARTERKSGRGYKGFVVDASDAVTLEDDLARRDLTINAMALSADGKLIDPFDGQSDLQNKVLRHTTESFSEDPVRVLRVARFLARFGSAWRIHPDTQKLVEKMSDGGELDYLVPERVWKETEKALGEDNPQLYFESLKNLGIFPEIDVMQGISQPAEHHPEGDVFVHTMLALKRAAELNFDLATRFAALTHDFGKPVSFNKRGMLRGHEADGVPVIDAFCERLRIPNKLRSLGMLTSEHHLRCHNFFNMTPKKIHKMMIQDFNAIKNPERFKQFLNACRCDAQGRGDSLVNKPYPQVDLGLYLLKGLSKLDTKAIVQDAVAAGKTGVELGEVVRISQIAEIKRLRSAYSPPNHSCD